MLLGPHASPLIIIVFTGINIFVPIFTIISGFSKGDLHNWQLTEQDYRLNTSRSSDIYSLGPLGSGGFVPFGFDGILRGAALCFYSFVGFDGIVMKGNMVIAGPIRGLGTVSATLGTGVGRWLTCFGRCKRKGDFFSFSFSFFAFTPVCFPDPVLPHTCRERSPKSSAFHHFEHGDLHLHRLFGVLWCLGISHPHGALLPDSSLQPLTAGFSPRWVGPGQICHGCCLLVCSFIQPPGHHVLHVSVDLCNGQGRAPFPGPCPDPCPHRHPCHGCDVFCKPRRYQPNLNDKTEEEVEMEPEVEEHPLDSVPVASTPRILKSLWFPASTIPIQKSGQIVYGCAFLVVLLLTILSLILAQWPNQVFSGDPGLTTVAVLLLLLITGVTVIIWRQPQDPSPLMFRVPALPVLPLVSIFVNIYLMMLMTPRTWTQFGIWNAIGFVIYFGYGIRHSLEENNDQQPPASTSQTLDKNIPGAESS